MKRLLFLFLALSPLVFSFKVVVSINTLAMIVKPIVGQVTVLVPAGMSPLVWKPSPQDVQKVLSADLFVSTLHWPFERQLAQRVESLPKYLPYPPAENVLADGFAILRTPNGDLNPHGWWLYAPNALLLMHEVAFKACMKEPKMCPKYLDALEVEVKKVQNVLAKCVRNLKAVVSVPGEEYALASFGVRTIFVLASKGTAAAVTGYELFRAAKYIKSADFVSVSDLTKNTPLGRILITLAKRYHKPIVVVPIVRFGGDYAQYLNYICDQLPVGR